MRKEINKLILVVCYRDVHAMGHREQRGGIPGGGETRDITVTFTWDSRCSPHQEGTK